MNEKLEWEELVEIATALNNRIYNLKKRELNRIIKLDLKTTKSALEKIEKEIEKLK